MKHKRFTLNSRPYKTKHKVEKPEEDWDEFVHAHVDDVETESTHLRNGKVFATIVLCIFGAYMLSTSEASSTAALMAIGIFLIWR